MTNVSNTEKAFSYAAAEKAESDLPTLLSGILKAGGDALRLEILRVLRRGAFSVLELSEMFAMRQSGMSHHLKVLSKAGLAETQREGNRIFYRRPLRNSHTRQAGELIRAMFKSIDGIRISPELQAKISSIHSLRAEQSQEFFSKNANRFIQQQELIAEYDQYVHPCKSLLASESFEQPCTALEIGPGSGEFLAHLSHQFDKVYALDNASAMLEQAKAFSVANKLCNIEFLLGEAELAIRRQIRVDAVVLNMVLHHLAHPAEMFQHSAQLLHGGGIVVVSDLTHHNQIWAREKCGDLWLGFEPEQLEQWANEAGLQEKDAVYMGLRNGFQVQVKKFKKM